VRVIEIGCRRSISFRYCSRFLANVTDSGAYAERSRLRLSPIGPASRTSAMKHSSLRAKLSRRSSSANTHHSPVTAFCNCQLRSANLCSIRNSVAPTLTRCPFRSAFSDTSTPEDRAVMEWQDERATLGGQWEQHSLGTASQAVPTSQYVARRRALVEARLELLFLAFPIRCAGAILVLRKRHAGFFP